MRAAAEVLAVLGLDVDDLPLAQLELLGLLGRELGPELLALAERQLDPRLEAELDDPLDDRLLGVVGGMAADLEVVGADEVAADTVHLADEAHDELVRGILVQL